VAKSDVLVLVLVRVGPRSQDGRPLWRLPAVKAQTWRWRGGGGGGVLVGRALDVEALSCGDLCACCSGDGPGRGAISLVRRMLLLLLLLLVESV
jgi:hypothetical protein